MPASLTLLGFCSGFGFGFGAGAGAGAGSGAFGGVGGVGGRAGSGRSQASPASSSASTSKWEPKNIIWVRLACFWSGLYSERSEAFRERIAQAGSYICSLRALDLLLSIAWPRQL